MCMICMDAPRAVRFRPCGHAVACADCAAMLRTGVAIARCPYCREVIEGPESDVSLRRPDEPTWGDVMDRATIAARKPAVLRSCLQAAVRLCASWCCSCIPVGMSLDDETVAARLGAGAGVECEQQAAHVRALLAKPGDNHAGVQRRASGLLRMPQR